MAQALIRGYDDRYALNDLWGAAFGDSPEFISAMYDAGYLRPSDVFALTEDGRLLCAVFLPEYRLCLQGRDYPIRLLSCVATDPFGMPSVWNDLWVPSAAVITLSRSMRMRTAASTW